MRFAQNALVSVTHGVGNRIAVATAGAFPPLKASLGVSVLPSAFYRVGNRVGVAAVRAFPPLKASPGLPLAGFSPDLPDFEPPSSVPSLQPPALSPERKSLYKAIGWIMGIAVGLILTVLLFPASSWLFGSLKPGIFVSTAIWALIIGFGVLYFASAKIVSVLFGAILGVSADEVAGANAILSKLASVVNELVKQIGGLGPPGDLTADPFVTQVVWVFVIILLVSCLPAFFKD